MKKSFNGQNGYTKLCEKGKSCMPILEFGIVKLEDGKQQVLNTEEKEMALIILKGKCTITVDNIVWEKVGKRRSVFDGPAYSAYIPPKKTIKIVAYGKVEIAVIQAPCNSENEPVLIKPEDVRINTLGKCQWKRAAHFLIDERINAENLYIGEAYINPGCWASFPPHKHDTDDMPDEAYAEELYYYQFNMPQGFGIQRVYTDDKKTDEVYVVKSNDLVEIPKGYHPFANAPGYCAYYLWIMGGKNRGFFMSFQDEHKWINALDTFIDKSL